jgi:hypothetical protein
LEKIILIVIVLIIVTVIYMPAHTRHEEQGRNDFLKDVYFTKQVRYRGMSYWVTGVDTQRQSVTLASQPSVTVPFSDVVPASRGTSQELIELERIIKRYKSPSSLDAADKSEKCDANIKRLCGESETSTSKSNPLAHKSLLKCIMDNKRELSQSCPLLISYFEGFAMGADIH